MKSLTMFTLVFITVLGSSSFAAHSYSHDDLTFTAQGQGYECRGFCSARQKRNEREATQQTDLNANLKCQDDGYEAAVLIDEYSCKSFALSECETLTSCFGSYRCE